MSPSMRVYEPGSRGWNLKRFSTSSTRVPASAGIYVLSQLHTVEGLPTSWRHVYVGKSENLRRRLDQHTMHTEVHSKLRDFMETHHRALWIWYTTNLLSYTLTNLEIALIRSLRPPFNRQHKPFDENKASKENI